MSGRYQEGYVAGHKKGMEDCADEIERLRQFKTENELLRTALDRALTGGNHIALIYKTERWPEPDTDPHVALEQLGAGQEYDMWCCWSALMVARRVLEGK